MLLKRHYKIKTLAFCLVISACTPVEKEPKNNVKNEVVEKALQLSEDIFNENLASSPEYQTSLGIKTGDYGK